MKERDLFDRIASFQALLEASNLAARGKRGRPDVAAFLAGQEFEALRLERELLSGSYQPGRYRKIEVFEPKHRIVSAAPFRDRVVHHAIHSVCGPLFERGFIFDSYANRTGKGTHRAVARYEKFRNRFRHVLRCDIYRYFPSIDHEILKLDIRRRIACDRTLDLIDRIIDASNPQEPVNLYFPGDDLLTPVERRRGIPIGNLTSQFFANVYLDRLDHYCKEVLRAKGYVRYVDDFALFHDDPGQLESWCQAISRFLERRRLCLHPRKTFIAATDEDALFLGFMLLPDGSRRLPEDNVRRFRKRLRMLQKDCRRGVACAAIRQRVTAWIAHAEHADTWRLRQAIFRGGLYDPFREPDRPPDYACCVAVPGTTNRGTFALRIATGTRQGTETTTTGSVLPARLEAGVGCLTGHPSVPAGVQGRS